MWLEAVRHAFHRAESDRLTLPPISAVYVVRGSLPGQNCEKTKPFRSLYSTNLHETNPFWKALPQPGQRCLEIRRPMVGGEQIVKEQRLGSPGAFIIPRRNQGFCARSAQGPKTLDFGIVTAA